MWGVKQLLGTASEGCYRREIVPGKCKDLLRGRQREAREQDSLGKMGPLLGKTAKRPKAEELKMHMASSEDVEHILQYFLAGNEDIVMATPK